MFNCSGGTDAVGLLDHLRGDHQRPRRRTGLHRRVQRRADQAARLRLRGAGRRSDRPASRSPRPAASRTRPSSFDPIDGILYLTEDNFEFPSGLLPLHPAAQPDEDRPARQRRPAADARGQGPARTSTSSAEQPQRATYDVEWVDIDDPAPEFPYTPGQPAPTTNDQALVLRRRPGPGAGRGVLLPAGGPGLRQQRRLLHLDPGRRRRRRPARTTIAAASATGHGQVWAYHTRSQTLQLLYQSPDPDDARLPRQRHDQRRAARSSSARTTPSTTTSAACPAAASCGTSR